MTVHATIDLETLDTKPSSMILSLGGVKFNPFTRDEPYEKLYFKINIDDQDRLNRSASDSTINWWSKQDPAIMEEAFDQSGSITVDQALDQINRWIVGVDILWGQGYGFDFTILEDLYRSANRPIPWDFWRVRDSRTLLKLLHKDPRKDMQMELHNAYYDAFYQSKAIQIALSDLGVTH